jgi:hypothetical protein
VWKEVMKRMSSFASFFFFSSSEENEGEQENKRGAGKSRAKYFRIILVSFFVVKKWCLKWMKKYEK